MNSDIEFIAGYYQIAKMSLQLAWLMLQRFGCSIADIRNTIMRDFLEQQDCEKVTHVIEVWRRLRTHEATARALVDLCCNPAIGGDRTYIEESLKSLAIRHQSLLDCGKLLHVFHATYEQSTSSIRIIAFCVLLYIYV